MQCLELVFIDAENGPINLFRLGKAASLMQCERPADRCADTLLINRLHHLVHSTLCSTSVPTTTAIDVSTPTRRFPNPRALAGETTSRTGTRDCHHAPAAIANLERMAAEPQPDGPPRLPEGPPHKHSQDTAIS